MEIRKTEERDIPFAVEIYENAREFMHSNGNPNQWRTSYPSEASLREDMKQGASYVCTDGDEVVAVFYFKIGEDPTYKIIYDGEWLTDGDYAVIHRIAVKYQGRNIAGFCFNEMFKLFPNIKIDTHKDNLPMQNALKKRGFKHCGIIHLENGDERLAFQKNIAKTPKNR